MQKTVRENPMLVLILLFLLVLMGPLGSISATFAQLALLVSLPFVLRGNALSETARQPVFRAFIAGFIALGFAFALATKDPLESLHAINFLAVLLALPLFVLGRRISQGELWQLIASAAMAGLVLSLGVALFQTGVQGLPRAEGYAGNSNILARFALISGFVSLVGFKAFSNNWRFLFLLGPVLGVMICLLSGSRGAFIAMPVFMLGAALFLLNGFVKKIGWFRAGLAVLTIAIVALVAMVLTSDRLSQLGATLMDVFAGKSGGEAIDVRLDMYQAGWRAFLAQPIFGHSWQHIVSAANDALVDTARTKSILDYRHLHNDFLNFAVGGGLVGIVAWLSFLLAPIIAAFFTASGSDNMPARYVLTLLPACVLVFGITDMTIGYDVITVTYFCLVSLALSARRAPQIT